MKTLRPYPTTVNIFLAIALVFGVFFVFTTPLLWGADETTHVGRVYQISQGHLLAQKIPDGFGGKVPATLKKVINYVNIDFNQNTHQVIGGVKAVDDPAAYREFSKLPLSGNEVNYNFSNTVVYPPPAYLPAIVGFKIAQILRLHLGPTIYLARLLGLAFYISCIAFTLYSLRAFRSKWIIFTIALLPMSIYQASVISADTVTNALSLMLIGLVLKSLLSKHSLTRLEVLFIALTSLSLPIVKPSYLFISLLALIVPTKRIPYKHFRKFIFPVAIVIGLLGFAAWQYKTRYLSNSQKYILVGIAPWWSQINSTDQLKYVVHHPFTVVVDFFRTIILSDNYYFDGLFGRLGFNYVQVPAFAIVTSFSALVLSVMGTETFERSKKIILSLVGVLLGSIAALFGVFYLTISAPGMSTIQGVQGRYFIPILPIFLLLIAYTTRMRLNATSRTAYRDFATCIVCLVLAGLLASSLKFYYVTWG